MPIKLSLVVTLGLQSIIMASLWWLAMSKIVNSNWIAFHINRALVKLPHDIQQRLTNFAIRQTTERTIAQWVVLRLVYFLSALLLVALPISGMLKVGFFIIIIGYALQQRTERRHYIRRALREWPNSLEMTAMLMHSGLSFRAALHAFQNTPNDSIALRELGRVQRAQQSGYTLNQALDALAARILHPWIQLFVGAVKQAQSTGGELANTLQRQAEQSRQQELLEAEKRAQEVSVKLMFPLIFCFFPVTMLLILGPVFISFMQGGMT